MKTALVTGITGQDGAYLALFLLAKGYRVVGAHRRTSKLDLSRLERLGIAPGEIELEPLELLEQANVMRLVDKVAPDEIYNLGAMTYVGVSWEQPIYTMDVNALGTLRLLEAARWLSLYLRFYQASTSEMFGKAPAPQSEFTPFEPRSPYGIAKCAAHWATVNYRESFDMFACSGILFNHESPLRGPEFVTQKIAQGLARIKHGKQLELELGNIAAERDWGFAGDYVEGMWMMLQASTPSDYVLATGVACTVKAFADLVADALEMELEWHGSGSHASASWQGKTVIRTSPKLYRPADVELLCGDATRARVVLGWEPKTSVAQLAAMMALEAEATLVR